MAYVKNKTVIKRFWSYSVILVSILAVFSLPSVLFAQSNIAETVNNSQRQVSLTPEERSWLQAHPDIVLGFAEGIEPSVIVDSKGILSGIYVDFLNEFNQRLGTNIDLQLDTVPKILKKVQNKEVDGIIALHPDYADKLGLAKTDGYMHGYPTVYAKESTVFLGPPDFEGKRVAIVDKVYFSEEIIATHGDRADIVKVPTALDGLQGIQNGTIDLFIGTSRTRYLISKYLLADVVAKHTLFNYSTQFVMAVRPDWPVFKTILNKGLASFTDFEIETISSRWMDEPVRDKQTVDLTAEERVWLAEHGPKIRVSLVNLPPLQFEQDGEFTGYQVDILEAVFQEAGLQPLYTLGPLPTVLKDLRENKTEISLDFIPTEERGKIMLFSDKKFDIYMGIFARKERVELNSIEALRNVRIASHPGYGLEPRLKRYLPNATIVYAKDPQSMFRLVAAGDADVVVHGLSAGEFMVQKNLINNVVSHGEFLAKGESRLKAAEFVVRKDLPHLMSIIDKTYASIDEAEKHSIWDKWFGKSSTKLKEKNVLFTDQERSWLSQNHPIDVRVTDLPPYIILKEGSEPEGISIDYLKLISERTGITFRYNPSGKTLPEALDGLKGHQGPDLITSMMRTPEREKSILFSKAYFKSPYVIFTHAEDKEFITDMADLVGKKIALPKGTVIHDKVKSEYPELTLDLYNNDAQAIDAVATRKVDAYIGNLTLASHLILEKGWPRIKIAGPSPFGDHIFSLGVRNDWPELVSIIDKGLATITPEEQAAIRNKYISIRYEHTEKSVIIKWVFIIGGIASVIILLFILWNQTLKKRVQERTEALENEMAERKWASEALSDSEEQYRGLVDNAVVGVFKSNFDGHLIFVNEALAKLYDFESAEKMVAEGSLPRWSDPDKREKWLAELQEHGSVSNFEAETVTHSGRDVHVLVSAQLVGNSTAGMVMDITERKKVEESLRESEEKFRQLVEQSPLAIQILNPDGRMRKVNEAFKNLWGISEEALPEVMDKYNILKDVEAEKLGVMPLIKKAFNGDHVTLPIIDYDAPGIMGTLGIDSPATIKRSILVRMYPIKDSQGKTTSVVQIEEDITDKIMDEQKILDYQKRVKAMASQLTLTEERERRHIAADLHDNVGQTLAISRLQLAAAAKSVDDSKLKTQLEELSQTLQQTALDTHHLIFELSSPTLNEIGLGAAIGEWFEDKMKNDPSIDIELIDKLEKSLLDKDLRAILFRNVKEVLTNTIKHAHADKVTVHLETVDDDIRIMIHDNGAGFDPEIVMRNVNQEGGFGLFSIQERMFDLGGKLDIKSKPHQGCTIILSAPSSQAIGETP